MASDLEVGDLVRLKCSEVLAVVAATKIIDGARAYQLERNGEPVTCNGVEQWYTREQLKLKREEN